MLDHDLGHLCFGTGIQTSGKSDFGFFSNVGEFSILSGYKQILHQLLVLRTLAVWIMISMILAAVICIADEPCSLNTA